MRALAIYQTEVCAGCKLHTTVADEDPDLEITIRICPVCAGMEQQQRVLAARDQLAAKARGENTPPSTPLPSDGRQLGLRPKPPQEKADTERPDTTR